ncbi:MAG: putative monovalent cation/H+ antiporter subunit A [Balneolales bacterium]
MSFMLISILSIFGLALGAPVLHKYLKENTGYVLALLPLGIFAYFLSLFPTITGGTIIRTSMPWFGGLDVNLSFFLDGLSYLFVLLITGIGTLIVLYASGYLKGHQFLGRFYLSLLLFMASMLGVVLSDNLITLFVFWELTSFTSYLLIGFNHENPKSRRSALQALLVTGTGGLALLAGAVLMAIAGGSMEISVLLTEGDVIRDHALYLPIMILVLAGAFTKSAQFPFHFWLPNAMEAPTPVSAYLHSATMVKAGIYLMARMNPILGGTDPWLYTVTIIGAVTMVVGAWLALCYTDLKQILAHSTIMALGTLTMLIGMGHPYAVEAAGLFILGHSFYKGALFMVAGTIDHETGTRNATLLGGLAKLMPITAFGAALAALSMSGIVPFVGFIAKELVYEAALGFEAIAIVMIVFAVMANIAVVASAGIVAIRPFYGEFKETPKKAHEAPWTMWIGPATLGGLSLLLGLLPWLIDESLISATASAIGGETAVFELALWHGFNLALGLSVLTLLAGVLVYLYWDPIRESLAMRSFNTVLSNMPENGYDHTVAGMLKFAGWQTRLFQSGYLRYYIGTMVSIMVIAVGYTLFSKASVPWPTGWAEIAYYEWVLAGLILFAGFASIKAKTGLGAIISLGVLGFSVALIFILYSAPDLALTQILVETLTVILFALVLVHLPNLKPEPADAGTFSDAVIAISAGGLMTMLMLAALSFELDPFISEYYAENSYTLAHGKNIVNVILVDFRALDTLGEVTVLAVAGIGIFSLIKLFRANPKKENIK